MWKDIPDTNSSYSANDETGDIKSNDRQGSDGRNLKGKILKPWIINSGYNVVSLCINGDSKKNFLVHRLIAKTYIDNYSEELDINHLNSNRTDNTVSNLECVTRRDNILHGIKHGNIKPLGANNERLPKFIEGCKRTLSKPVDKCDPLTGEKLESYESISEAARQNNYQIASIARTAKGTQKTSYGFNWQYSNITEKCND